MDNQLEDIADGTLADYLIQRGIPFAQNEREFHFAGTEIKVKLRLAEVETQEAGSSVEIFMDLDCGDRLTIYETMLGIGDTPENATMFGVQDMADSVLVTTLNLFAPELVEPRGDISFSVKDKRWRLQIGPIITNDPSGGFVEFCKRNLPINIVLKTVAPDTCTDNRPHWIKIYCIQLPEQIAGEVRVDNHPNARAWDELTKIAVPAELQKPLIFQQFGIMAPV